jgi:hypothetical protein
VYVRLRRGRDFARIVAIILLVWTALDLSAYQLCALDRMDEVGSFSDARRDATDTPREPSFPSSPHVDDCFCCSPCVDVGHVQPALVAAGLTPALTSMVDARAPRSAGRSLFHPPQLL